MFGWSGDKEFAERNRFEAPIEAPLRRRVTGGLIIAVLLTGLLGFSYWHSSDGRSRMPTGYPTPTR
jgi:hypothetical protein